MLAGGRNSRCNPLDDSPLSFALCVSFSLVGPHSSERIPVLSTDNTFSNSKNEKQQEPQKKRII